MEEILAKKLKEPELLPILSSLPPVPYKEGEPIELNYHNYLDVVIQPWLALITECYALSFHIRNGYNCENKRKRTLNGSSFEINLINPNKSNMFRVVSLFPY